MLIKTQIEEELSLAYVHAVASHAGFSVERIQRDMDSVDVSVHARGKLTSSSTVTSPKLDIQLKASWKCDLSDPHSITYSLKIKNYDDLRGNSMVPRILVLLCLPPQHVDWLSHSVNDLVMRKCAYWVSLKGLPTVPNTTTRDIVIPKGNIFSQVSIKSIMELISEEKPL